MQRANPSSYPQGYFKEDPCRHCGKLFTPKVPSEHYCSDSCKDYSAIDAYFKRNYNLYSYSLLFLT